ncbi:MAG: hypothetical protein NC343_06070 [Muribaculum sp.]|nr:hypothetical protein [Muribaculaceae bacterium]MCM1081299.1 hypothetical protein [Muribaculum sp.]
MKKLLCLLLALPMFLLSCSDDDKFPQFDVNIVFGQGVTVENNVITVTQGQPFTIESISPENADVKEIAFGAVTYQLDYGVGLTTNLQPFAMSFDTSAIPVGRHLFQITFPVFAVDYSVMRAVITYELVVLPEDENPDTTPTGGSSVVTPKVSAS